MGTRKRQAKQASMWVATQDLPRSAAHPFYARLNQILDQHDFDGFVEGLCERFYADEGRPGLPPGRYFRLLLIGYFEGLDAERAIAWRAADSFAVRECVGLVLLEAPSGVETPTRADLARIDRKRKQKGSNDAWTHPHDPDAKITKMKDGRTHLAHKAEQAVDLETGAIIGVTVQDADDGDATTCVETLIEAAEQVETVRPDGEGIEEIVGDKGSHSNQSLLDLEAVGVRSDISEPDRSRRNWKKPPQARDAVYRNRRRIRGPRGLRLLRLRGERLERPFAHLYETGGLRRVYLRGHTNIRKRLLIHAGGLNLGLLMRQLIGVGTPRGLQGRLVAVLTRLLTLIRTPREAVTCHRSPLQLFSRLERFSIASNSVAQIGVRELAFTTSC